MKRIVFFILILVSNLFLNAERMNFSMCQKVANNKLIQLEKSSDFSIENVEKSLNVNDENVLSYVFDLSPQGYIVTTCESDLPPIIAYSFTSQFFDEKSGDLLAELIAADVSMRLQNLSHLPAEILEQRNLAWSNLINETSKVDRFEQWPPEGTTPTGGWLLSNWTQNAPYNNLCPIDPENGSRSIAGCPSIAMAQILDFHRTTNQVYFDDSDDYYHNYPGRQYWIDDDYIEYQFPSFPELNGYLNTLSEHYLWEMPITNTDKAALVFACGVAATQVYTSQSSGTLGVEQAYEAYQKFNFSDVSLLNSTSDDVYEQISQNIKDALPVHFASVTPQWDVGHNFVVDGYNTDEYFHINFGWGGTYNGWYLLPDEIPYGLTVLEGAIVDIMPNPLPHGFIGGQVVLNPAPADTLNISILIENLSGTYSQTIEPNSNGIADFIEEVPIGIYSVTASYPNYETVIRSDIIVEELQFSTVDFVLSAIFEPTELAAEIDENEVTLEWQHPQARGFEYFNIYRNINSSTFILLDSTSSTSYMDFVEFPQVMTLGYRITAIYAEGNESLPSNEVFVEYIPLSTENDLVSIPSLTNFPNPFNPITTIRFSCHEFELNERITLEILNVKGQRVRQFIMKMEDQKMHEIIWNGTDNKQKPVASGVYFYRLKSKHFTSMMKKMLLLQ